MEVQVTSLSSSDYYLRLLLFEIIHFLTLLLLVYRIIRQCFFWELEGIVYSNLCCLIQMPAEQTIFTGHSHMPSECPEYQLVRWFNGYSGAESSLTLRRGGSPLFHCNRVQKNMKIQNVVMGMLYTICIVVYISYMLPFSLLWQARN